MCCAVINFTILFHCCRCYALDIPLSYSLLTTYYCCCVNRSMLIIISPDIDSKPHGDCHLTILPTKISSIFYIIVVKIGINNYRFHSILSSWRCICCWTVEEKKTIVETFWVSKTSLRM